MISNPPEKAEEPVRSGYEFRPASALAEKTDQRMRRQVTDGRLLTELFCGLRDSAPQHQDGGPAQRLSFSGLCDP